MVRRRSPDGERDRRRPPGGLISLKYSSPLGGSVAHSSTCPSLGRAVRRRFGRAAGHALLSTRSRIGGHHTQPSRCFTAAARDLPMRACAHGVLVRPWLVQGLRPRDHEGYLRRRHPKPRRSKRSTTRRSMHLTLALCPRSRSASTSAARGVQRHFNGPARATSGTVRGSRR